MDKNIPTSSRHFNVLDSPENYSNYPRRSVTDDKKSDKTSDSDTDLKEAEDLLKEIDEYHSTNFITISNVNKQKDVSLKQESVNKIVGTANVKQVNNSKPKNKKSKKDECENLDSDVKQTVSSNPKEDVSPTLHTDNSLQQAECKVFLESDNYPVSNFIRSVVKATEESTSGQTLAKDTELENRKLDEKVVDLTDVLRAARHIKSPSIENIFDTSNDVLNEDRRPECVIISAPTTEIITCAKDSVGVLPGRLPGLVPRYKVREIWFDSITVIDSVQVTADEKRENKKKGKLKRLFCGCFENDQTEIEAILDAATKKDNAKIEVSNNVDGPHADNNSDNDHNDEDAGTDHVYMKDNGVNDGEYNDDDFVHIIIDDSEINVNISEENTIEVDILHFDGNIEVKETRLRKLWRRIRGCFI
ncbi:hypothetical protein ACF0H5_003543 [Mactra antiquata]